MKFVLLAVFILFFVALPLYMLDAVLMPQLTALKTTYANAYATASNVAGVGE